ncbi:MAG: carboxymuconolactone decarboxylase family protein [Actinomycetota bacterium]|nr:carboxymuconolactone decarboxylase family protein [Actinomycetota bacterium]
MTTSTPTTEENAEDPRPEPRMVLAREAHSSYKVMRELDGSLAEYGLDRRLILLVQTRVSQINGCAFCIDMHIKEAVHLGESMHRCYSLDAWRETSYYSPEERAALALAEAMTKLVPGGVPDTIWDDAAGQFEPRRLAGLVMTIVCINAWNRMAITTRSPAPGSYQPSA